MQHDIWENGFYEYSNLMAIEIDPNLYQQPSQESIGEQQYDQPILEDDESDNEQNLEGELEKFVEGSINDISPLKNQNKSANDTTGDAEEERDTVGLPQMQSHQKSPNTVMSSLEQVKFEAN